MGRMNVKGHTPKYQLAGLMGGYKTFAAMTLLFLMAQAGLVPAVAQTPVPKTPPAVGTIKNIGSGSIVLSTEAGAEVRVQLGPEVKYLRVEPGSKDLKDAAVIQVSDLQVGDRILVRGKAGDDAGSLIATTVIAMKKADLDQKKAHDQEEWQRHGIGGLVKTIDAANNTITIGTMSASGAKDVTINVSKSTILRRYAPGSVKFDDAKASSFPEIKPGDQLRARGTKSDDGNSFLADEIVTGSFRNVSGTISSMDTGAATITIADLLSNKPVTIHVGGDTQLRKLPPQMAQMIAARLKTAAAGGPQGAAPQGPGGMAPASGTPGTAAGAGGPVSASKAQGGGGGGRGDMQQMLSRLPASTLNDFQKGDAVLVVAASSSTDSNLSAITVVGGVEPILQASPQGQASSILQPWSLNNGGGDAGTQ